MAAAPVIILLAAELGLSFAAASALYATWDAEGVKESILNLVDRLRFGSPDEAALGKAEILNFAQGTLTSAGLAAQALAQGVVVEELRRQIAAARAGLTAPGDISTVEGPAPSVAAQEGQAGALAGLGSTLERVLGGVGVGSLAAALSQALVATSGQRAHSAQEARYRSHSGFPGALLAQVQRLLPSIAAGTFTFLQADMRNLMFGDAEQFIDDQLNPDRYAGPASEETAPELAAQRIKEAVGFGQKAALLALSLEALSPMKQLGFSQYSGLMASFAGFERMAAGLMGTVENAAIYAPLRWRANRRFRPTIPQDQAIGLFYAKKELTPSQMAHFLTQNGLSDFWIEVNRSAMFLDPRLGEIVRIGQFFQPKLTPALANVPDDVRLWWNERQEWVDIFSRLGISQADLLGEDWYWYYKLAKGGYEPADVLVLTQVAKRATARREQTQYLTAATRLYRDGYIDDARFTALVDQAWEFDNPKEARLLTARLIAELKEKVDYRSMVLRSVSRGILSHAAGRERLIALGMRPARVDLDLLGERLGGLPRLILEPIADEADFLEEVGV